MGAQPLLLGLRVAANGAVSCRSYYQCTDGLALLELESLLRSLGLAHRLPDLALRAADLTGGRLILPSRSVVLAVRAGTKPAVKVELMGSALDPGLRGPEPLPVVLANLSPAVRVSFARWYELVGDAELGFTDVAVASVGVSVDLPSWLTIYLRSAPLERS